MKRISTWQIRINNVPRDRKFHLDFINFNARVQ